MTKEEKIKEAYGDKWELFNGSAKQCALKNNGWISPILEHSPKDIELDRGDKNIYRPKSLRGIENNNGWNLIEDLDISDNEYVLFLRMTEGGEVPIFTCPAGEDFQVGYFTHWKRIDISKPPIY